MDVVLTLDARERGVHSLQWAGMLRHPMPCCSQTCMLVHKPVLKFMHCLISCIRFGPF